MPTPSHAPLKLQFFGAAGEVTGSCYHLSTPTARILIDFGLFQGLDSDRKNRSLPPFKPAALDAVVLTHAHLDHSGRLPLLLHAGFKGPIFATPRTIELTRIILEDAARIQHADALEDSKRLIRAGLPPVQPLYSLADVQRVFARFQPIPYDSTRTIAKGLSIRLIEAGHILGSASVEVSALPGPRSNASPTTIVFSADIGPPHSPILRDPDHFHHAHAVVLESTYGDRDHRSQHETLDEFASVINHALAHHGKVLIPAFAVGRTQDIIYHLANLIRDKRIPPVACFVDSPMGLQATRLYQRAAEIHDDQARSLRRSRAGLLSFPGLAFTKSSAQSRKINDVRSCIVIAASGMCTGGRILHHFKHALWQPSTHVIFVGYQSLGTLGRQIVDGAQHVQILGQSIAVRAQIHTIGGFSAHAGQSQLLDWLRPIAQGRAKGNRAAPKSPRVFLTHGENAPRQALARLIKSELNLKPILPKLADSADFT